jgi:uncharacterized protein YneF (UPF0154 family)
MSLWIILLIFLPLIIIIGGILAFNIYLRKQIVKDTIKKPAIDEAYLKAEETMPDDEDLGSLLDKGKTPHE